LPLIFCVGFDVRYSHIQMNQVQIRHLKSLQPCSVDCEKTLTAEQLPSRGRLLFRYRDVPIVGGRE